MLYSHGRKTQDVTGKYKTGHLTVKCVNAILHVRLINGVKEFLSSAILLSKHYMISQHSDGYHAVL